MTPSNLQELLDESGNTVELLRNSQIGAYIYPVVPYEFTNWRREQRAWRETAVLFDQSHHMANLFMRGPGAIKLISDTGINSVANFPVNMAKQFVPCTPAGHVIGDGILFHLDDEEYVWVGRAPVANWLAYQAETGGYDVEIEKDDRSPGRPYGKAVTRKYWRFQIQGPNAWQVIEKVNGGPVEQLKFFRMAEMNVARQARAHAAPRDGGSARAWSCGAPTRAMTRCAAPSSRPAASSAWSRAARAPTPPTRSSPGGSRRRCRPSTRASELRGYREWLGADSYEATNALAGSFVSEDVEDYYLNPWELGYGQFVKFDHDFLGRDALADIDAESQRHKVTLAWDAEDVAKIFASMFDTEGRELPVLRSSDRQLRLLELRQRARRRR